ncbi:MAG: ABC transporter permease [Eubacteriaceae bacterium]|nr:ABC transporter permease [Eubacteriaceae bacterium]MCR4894244.1 ABC transporter permease [Eubacteriales bacterium]
MARQIRDRLISLVIILLGLSIMTYGLTYLLPSDPVDILIDTMGLTHDPETVAALEKEYGLDQPFWVQYTTWLKGIFHGDFGYSIKYQEPVATALGRKLPNTIKLACSAFVMMVLISFPLGILSAVYRNKTADYIIRALSFVGVSMPTFWFGMILIYLLGVRLKILPVAGFSSWKSIIMPTLTLGITNSAYYIRRIRAVMVEQLGEGYISGLKSRGVSRKRIIFRHVLPNSLLAVITMLGMSFGGMLGGTMIVETIFSWNGIGSAAMAAISARDYKLIQGYVLWMGFIYVMVNLVVDISYQFIDPRIRRGEAKK